MESGRLTNALQETLAEFDGGGEPLTTTEVAESLDVGRRSTYERLERLAEAGKIETKKVGASARIWWQPSPSGTAPSRQPISHSADTQGTEHSSRTQTEPPERVREELKNEFDSVFDRIADGFYILDDEMRLQYLNEYAKETLGLGEGAIGSFFLEVVTTTERIEKALFDAFERQEPVIVEEYDDPAGRWFSNALYPSENGLSVYFRDVTERKDRELQLERYAEIINAVGEPVYELDPDGCFTFVNEPFVALSGYTENELLGEHVSIGMGQEAIARSEAKIQTLLKDDPDKSANLEYEVITKEGERIPVENRISLLRDDEGIVRGSAGVIRDVTERKERKRELEHQREQVVALNNVNETVRKITEAVIDQSTREEIERAACEELADSDSYTFAWIAEVVPQTQEITPRIEVGADGYLEDIELSADMDEPVGQGPAGRAVRTGEMQVSTNVFEDSTFEPWQEYADRYGYNSFAAIPIAHENTFYGFLGLYSERTGAFAEVERTVVGQLGEIIGHAIAAADRKQALLSDDVVELQFRIHDVFDVFDLDVPTTGRISIDHTISIGDEEFLHFGTVTEDAIETLKTGVDAMPEWLAVRFWEDGSETAFELRVSSPPILTEVAALGGSIERAVVEDGDYSVTIHLAPGADTRPLVETFQEHYPGSKLVKRQQITRPKPTAEIDASDVESELTSRQRTVLETALYAGYFEWPRETSGEEVAALLNIAPSTFSQHIRNAQKSLVTSLFSST